MFEQIVAGVLAGVAYSLAGWQKGLAKKNVVPDFNWAKLGKSVAICALVGGVAGWQSLDFNVVVVGGLGVAVTNLVNLAIKILPSWFDRIGL